MNNDAMKYLDGRLVELTENPAVYKDRVLNARLTLLLELVNLFLEADPECAPETSEIDAFVDEQFLLNE